LRYLGCILLGLAVAGCDGVKDTYARSVAEDAQRRSMDANTDVILLKQKLKDIEDRQDRLSNYISAVDSGQEALRKTVNFNAGVNNDNAVRDMTRRGACGRQWVQFANGTYGWQNKECSKGDLKKSD